MRRDILLPATLRFLAVVAALAPASAFPDPPAGTASRPRLAIIAPAAWIPALAPLVEVRKRTLDVETPALEDVLASTEGADAPERIKRFLWRAWKERGLRYALLVGDADTFPVRFMVLDRVTEPAFDTAFYGCDLYYADVAKADGSFDDWNAAHDGFHARYFGEVNGEKHKDPPMNLDQISYVPEVAVGRFPVSTLDDLSALVAKTVAWEARASADSAPHPRRALWLHTDGWVDARAPLTAASDGLAKAGWTVTRQFFGAIPAGESKSLGPPTPEGVLSALTSGAELVVHAGHGCEAGWPGCVGDGQCAALASASSAIYVSAGCGTAVFVTQAPYEAYLDADGAVHKGTNDGEVFRAPPPPPAPLQPGRFNASSFGERSVRLKTGGAIAYIGCDTGSQPCALTVIEGFAQSLSRDARTPRRLGDAWNAAVAHYHEAEHLSTLRATADWYPASIFFQAMKFVVLGDPSLPVP